MIKRLLFLFFAFILLFQKNSLSSEDNYSFYKSIYNNKSLFQNCNISFDDASKAFDIMYNNNFAIDAINNINNQFLKNAMLLLGLSNKNSSLSINDRNAIIDKIGLEKLIKIPQIRKEIFSLLQLKNYPINMIVNQLDFDQLSYYDKIDILYMIDSQGISDKVLLQRILSELMYHNLIKKNDLKFIMSIYKNYITEEMILAQLRQSLYKKDISSVDYLMLFLKNTENLRRARFLIDIYKLYHVKKTAKNKFSLLKYQQIDEYIDLLILDSYHDLTIQHDILRVRRNVNLAKDQWLRHRSAFAREIISSNIDSKIHIAYDIIGNIDSELYSASQDYYAQQWLAGYLAFNIGDFDSAIKHFRVAAEYATTVNSLARAYYWLGCALKKNNIISEAQEIFHKASNLQFTFYGQIAATEIDIDPIKLIQEKIILFEKESVQQNINLCKNFTFIASYLGYITNISKLQYGYIKTFFDIENDPIIIAKALKILETDTQRSFYYTAAHYAANNNVFLINASFPKLNEVNNNLIKAIIKQESGLQSGAISTKGAKGIMQITTPTAKFLAKQLGIEYDNYKLLFDNEYNLTLGHHYVLQLLNKYDNHKILTLAAYNAGPSPVKRWIISNGDPRALNTDLEVANWIESIPYKQTRDYVIKTLGYDMVYEAIDNIVVENH